jgi:hypothetical protein
VEEGSRSVWGLGFASLLMKGTRFDLPNVLGPNAAGPVHILDRKTEGFAVKMPRIINGFKRGVFVPLYRLSSPAY